MLRNALDNIRRLARSIADPESDSIEDRDRKRIFSIYSLILMVLLLVFGTSHIWNGNFIYGVLNYATFAGFIACIILLPRLKTGRVLFRISLFVMMLLLSYWLVTGAMEGFASIWVLAMPLFTFFLLGKREGLAWAAIMSLVTVLVFINPVSIGGMFAYHPQFVSRHLFVLFVIILFTYIYESVRERFKKSMEDGHAKLLREKELLAGTRDELRGNRDRLEEIVAERTAQLQKKFEELEANEKRYRLLADNVADLIWTMDMELHFTFLTPSVTEMFGYSVEEAMALPIDRWSPPAVTEWVSSEVIKEIEIEMAGTGDPNRFAVFQIEQYKKDGSLFWVEIRVSFLRDDDGKAIGFVGITRDIDARKRAEEALKESEEQLRGLSENIAEGMVYQINSGRDGRSRQFTYLSPAIERLHGLKAEDVKRDPMLIYGQIDEEYRSAAMEAEARSFETMSKLEIDIPVRVPQGEVRWRRFISSPRLQPDGCVIWDGIELDITEQKRAEDALKESEEKLRGLSDNIAHGMVYQVNTGVDGKSRVFTYLSPAAERLHGHKTEDIWKEPDLIYKQVDEKYLPAFVEGEKQAIVTMSRFDFDTPLRLPSGEVRWRRFSSSPRRQPDGSILWDGIEMDITEQKRAEEERNSLQERLQRAEKMEALGTLAGGVAHDLNNVLGVLVGYSELLLFDLRADSHLRDHIEQIMNSGARAAAIVQDLLTLARRGVHSEQVFSLNTVIRDFQRTPEFESLCASNPGVRIEIDLAGDLLNIKGSPPHISKTLMNLLINAVEAMRDGGTVRVATGNRALDRPVRGYDHVREGDYAVLSVSDTGEGIPAADMNHIFEPFYTKKVMGRSGTGLGLSVVWGTVKDHNGYIDLSSEEGKGTVFTLYFPVTRDTIIPLPSAVPLSAYTGNDETILVVDDIKEQRELASRMLGMLNYRVVTAASGEEALEYLESNRADLVILDMIMHPGMDGLETYRRIIEVCPGQKTIIVSGYSETDRVREAQALGAGRYIRKPYILENLGLAVRKELDRPAAGK
jgi:PAS domain S-box-containing protein